MAIKLVGRPAARASAAAARSRSMRRSRARDASRSARAWASAQHLSLKACWAAVSRSASQAVQRRAKRSLDPPQRMQRTDGRAPLGTSRSSMGGSGAGPKRSRLAPVGGVRAEVRPGSSMRRKRRSLPGSTWE